MPKSLLMAFVCAALIVTPALGSEKGKKAAAKKKAEVGASCKAPAVGMCAACNIVCRPGETAVCTPGFVTGDACHPQPSCRCSR